MSANVALPRRELIRRAARDSMGRRQAWGAFVVGLCWLAVVAAMAPVVAVLGYTVARGLPAWNLDFFTQLPTPAGIPGGGIANAIVGSLIIDAMAAVVAMPLGVLMAFFLAERHGSFSNAVRFGADVLAGVPSITIGIFAYVVLVESAGHFSAVSASFALAVLMLPIVVRGSESAIRSIPNELWEGGQALGVTRAVVALRVILPAAVPGVLTACLLAFARAAGESAPLLFTSIGNQYYAFSPGQPMASVPLLVYLNGIQAYPDLQQTAWGAALLLVVLILVLSLISRFLVGRLQRR